MKYDKRTAKINKSKCFPGNIKYYSKWAVENRIINWEVDTYGVFMSGCVGIGIRPKYLFINIPNLKAQQDEVIKKIVDFDLEVSDKKRNFNLKFLSDINLF